MENISSKAELQDAIQSLEVEQTVKLKLMKEHFHVAYENLKPAKFIENTLKDIASSPHLVNKIMVLFTGLLTGYISIKVLPRRSNTKLKKLFRYVLQFGLSNLITQNTKVIKSIGQFVSRHFFRKRK